MLSTRLTTLLGCSMPLQQAPMGGVTSAALASAVAEAGGIGMLPMQLMPAAVVASTLDDTKHVSGVLGVTFLMPFFDEAAFEEAIRRVRLVDFFYAEPDAALVRRVHDAGALASWQVGSVEEARAAEAAGCDFITVQGTEAGGRIRGQTGLLPLLARVLNAVSIPVVAAGGIGNPRAAAAAFAAGADGVRLGTRFLGSEEANVHPGYLDALIRARAEDTVVTDAFSVMWPRGPESHRVLRSAVEAADAFEEQVVGEIQMGGQTITLDRYSIACPNKQTTGQIEAMALYAGQSVDDVERLQPAAEIAREIVEGAETLLRRW